MKNCVYIYNRSNDHQEVNKSIVISLKPCPYSKFLDHIYNLKPYSNNDDTDSLYPESSYLASELNSDSKQFVDIDENCKNNNYTGPAEYIP